MYSVHVVCIKDAVIMLYMCVYCPNRMVGMSTANSIRGDVHSDLGLSADQVKHDTYYMYHRSLYPCTVDLASNANIACVFIILIFTDSVNCFYLLFSVIHYNTCTVAGSASILVSLSTINFATISLYTYIVYLYMYMYM